jgi:repressor LexA
MTHKQSLVFLFIKRFIDENGFPPTIAEVATERGFLSLNAARGHIDAIAKKGFLQRSAGVARGIRLCETRWPWILRTEQGEVWHLMWGRAE